MHAVFTRAPVAPYSHRTGPAIFDRLRVHCFLNRQQVHAEVDHDTANYVLPRTRTKFGERGVCYSGPAAWNGLPSELHDRSLTLTHSENGSRAYYLIVLIRDFKK